MNVRTGNDHHLYSRQPEWVFWNRSDWVTPLLSATHTPSKWLPGAPAPSWRAPGTSPSSSCSSPPPRPLQPLPVPRTTAFHSPPALCLIPLSGNFPCLLHTASTYVPLCTASYEAGFCSNVTHTLPPTPALSRAFSFSHHSQSLHLIPLFSQHFSPPKAT